MTPLSRALRRRSHRIARRLTRPRARARSAERGSASIFVVGMAVTLFACAGLVLDAGTALNARMRLADQVEQAARAGAQRIDLVELRENQVVVLDPMAAEAAALDYMTSVGHPGAEATVDGGQVTVTATGKVDTALLSLIGINDFSIRARATSEAVTR